MHDEQIPELTFSMVAYGKLQTPWNLRPLLYKGGAGALVTKAERLIDAGVLGPPLVDRFDLVKNIHEEIKASLVGGGSRNTAESAIEMLRRFYWFADTYGLPMNMETIASSYVHWTDHLLHRVYVVKNLSMRSAYNYGSVTGHILDKVLGRSTKILFTTRLSKPSKGRRIRGVEADKQRLDETFAFGSALLDIADALNLEALWGPLPLRIRLRSGKEWEEWSGLPSTDNLRCSNPKNRWQRHYAKVSTRLRNDWENDRTLRTRYPLVNLRIEAELLIFIGQTGMNLSQAHRLKVTQYSYKSSINGYEVRDYKNRRSGEVLFEIFAEYREVFERYLKWRDAVFPNDPDGLLFPLCRRGGRHVDTAPMFSRMITTCKKIGVKFIRPNQLRNTRINWLLRRSRDPDLTADMDQHHKQTLLQIYDEPSMQSAMTEIMRFWQTTHPGLDCPAPGVCDGVPIPIDIIPAEAPKPDCIRPAGCLWCDHHRDIDNEDYVWSMASMRHLQIIALRGFGPQENSSESARHVELSIERLTVKLHWFKDSNNLRRSWVIEAFARIDEASYHPHWHYLIVSIEGD